MQVHSTAYLGMNKTDEVCNQLYFTNPRAIIRDVIANCCVCSQAQTLKTVDKMIHIRAAACNEKWQIDIHELTSFNNGVSLLMAVVCVFFKLCFTQPLTI